MPFFLTGLRRRSRLEEETRPVPLLNDIWTRQRIEASHVAGLHSLVSTMATELAHLRYAVERTTDQAKATHAEVVKVAEATATGATP